MTPDEILLLASAGEHLIEDAATLICTAILYGERQKNTAAVHVVPISTRGIGAYFILVVITLYSLAYVDPTTRKVFSC